MSTSDKLRMSSFVLCMILFESSALARSADWQVVQNLQPGTNLSVKARHRYLCFFESATDDELVCETPRHRRLAIPRAEIREIRVGRSQAKTMWIGAGVGAGVGAAVGASKSYRGANAGIGAFGGALVGSVAGGIVAIFQRGKVIYRP
jgi:hypothetical protein